MKRFLAAALMGALMAGQLSGCASGQDRLLVFAASSLTDAMEQLGEVYQAQQGVRVDFNVGASNALSQQIARGAPADVFIAAGVQPVDRLEAEALVLPGTRRDLLTNRLVLVVPVETARHINSLEDLRETDVLLAMADPDLAPAGQYTREALVNLDLWQALESRLVYGANVRTTLGYLESGNVGAALVYRTDAAISDQVQVVVTLPGESYSPIRYPGVVLTRSENQQAAEAFLEFLSSPEAAQVFSELGFTPVGE